MSKKYVWKVWLVPNPLTKETKIDYYADVDTSGKTLYNMDAALAIKAAGSELSVETIVDILNRGDHVRMDALITGQPVQTLLTHISPRVPGAIEGAVTHLDTETHKPTCDMTVTAEMHNALKDVGIAVLGIKQMSAYIGLVTDVTTGLTDGTITPNGDIIIDGAKIKITPDDVATNGIFFIDAEGTSFKVTHRLTQNNPKRVIARIPDDLVPGEYTLKIVTNYAGKKNLKEAREMTYVGVLKVNELPNV
jgi:hypothetical protein